MPFEDGQWDDESRPAPADSTSLGSTSHGPGEAPDKEVFFYDEDSFTGDASPVDQVPHPETQTSEESAPASAPIATAPSPKEPLPEFDPRFREDMEGLLYLGQLEDEFTWIGHRFKIRTLSAGEILEVGLLHKRYRGTLADVKAYQAAVVAACVVSVDGRPMPTPLTNEVSDTGLSNRFDYVLRSWFPPTLDTVYERYLLLETRVREVLDAMGKASGSTELILT